MKKLFAGMIAVIMTVFICAIISNAQTNTESNPQQTTKNIKPLKIIKKPRASMEGNCSQPSGTVKLLVIFDKSAKVTGAEVISSSGCRYFDNSALEVSKKIKFEPQTEDGEPVTVKKSIEYTFTYY